MYRGSDEVVRDPAAHGGIPWTEDGEVVEIQTLLARAAVNTAVDRHYIMFALGLLAQSEPLKAARVMQKYLVPI